MRKDKTEDMRYKNAWQKERYDRLGCRARKDERTKERIKDSGESENSFVLTAIKEKLEREGL